jgi:hypothetical protein
MPLFMDIHENLPAGTTAQDVAGAHEADLRVQAKYGVKYIRYFMDEAAGKVWCVSDAPSAEASVTVWFLTGSSRSSREASRLARPELAISRVAKTRDDVALLVEALVESGDVDRYIGVRAR